MKRRQISQDIILIPLSFNNAKAYITPKTLILNDRQEIPEFYQTNEAPTYYVEKYLKNLAPARTLDKIYLIASSKTREPLKDNKTTVDLYKEHILSVLPALSGKFETIEYDENSTQKNLENNVLQISRIADHIHHDFPGNQFDNNDTHIAIHADMTGGVRDLALVILNTIQLLTLSPKSRFEAGKIVYANLHPNKPDIIIDDATEIYQTTRLIAGASEFIESGSVNQLMKFFDRQLTECYQTKNENPDNIKYIKAVKTLLTAMRGYSDTILVCGRFYLDDAKKALKEAINRFDSQIAGCNIVTISMFQKLKEAILTEYHDLLKDDSTILDTIRWCTRRHYLQQSLTFCTEQTPRIFVQSGLITPKDSTVLDDITICYREYLSRNHRETEYNPDSTPENDDELAKYFISDYLKQKLPKDAAASANDARAIINNGIGKIFTSCTGQDELAPIYAGYIDLQRKRNNISHAKKAPINIQKLPKDIEKYIDTLEYAFRRK